MKLRYARVRLGRARRRLSLSSTFAVPPLATELTPSPVLAVTPTPLILGELRGYRRDGVLVIVTPRGTELPIPAFSDWLVIDVVRYIGQVDRWPELQPGAVMSDSDRSGSLFSARTHVVLPHNKAIPSGGNYKCESLTPTDTQAPGCAR